jgi:hypothetical protein
VRSGEPRLVDRLKSETELWSGLAAKLAEIRSVPDAVKLYQECILQRAEMAKADARRLLDEYGTIMQKVNRSLTNSGST